MKKTVELSAATAVRLGLILVLVMLSRSLSDGCRDFLFERGLAEFSVKLVA